MKTDNVQQNRLTKIIESREKARGEFIDVAKVFSNELEAAVGDNQIECTIGSVHVGTQAISVRFQDKATGWQSMEIMELSLLKGDMYKALTGIGDILIKQRALAKSGGPRRRRNS